MSRNIVFEGWLTKSPPSKRIWRTKWRRRWFALRQSGELPGQYFLDYYADRNCRRLKGTINLDLCEQVDAGLHMERAGNGILDPKLRGSVFTIQTQSRTYHLEADCEAEMEKWVDAICRVCGLRSSQDEVEAYQYRPTTTTVSNVHYESPDIGPYIPISECITGARAQSRRQAFAFDSRQLVVNAQKVANNLKKAKKEDHVYINPPQVNIEVFEHLSDSDGESPSNQNWSRNKNRKSETNSNTDAKPSTTDAKPSTTDAKPSTTDAKPSTTDAKPSTSDAKPLTADAKPSTTDAHDGSVTKTFNNLAVHAAVNVITNGPPVPPRPSKTLPTVTIEDPNCQVQVVKFDDPVDPVQQSIANYTGPGTPWLRVPARSSRSPRSTSRKARTTSSPKRTLATENKRTPSSTSTRSPVLEHSSVTDAATTFDSNASKSPVANATKTSDSNASKSPVANATKTPDSNASKFSVAIATVSTVSNVKRATISAGTQTADSDTTITAVSSATSSTVSKATQSLLGSTSLFADAPRSSDDEDGDCQTQQSMQYYNLPTVALPPAIDRALKPRLSSAPVINPLPLPPRIPIPQPPPKPSPSTVPVQLPPRVPIPQPPPKPAPRAVPVQPPQPAILPKTNHTLHYLDLDFPPCPEHTEGLPRKVHIIHGRSMSAVDREAVYKTVDFVKTEAFNSTRQDAEALRSYQC